MVPAVAVPPAAGMQNQNKIWAVVIGAVVLFAVYHFSAAAATAERADQLDLRGE
jgi:hypothetical protein